MTRGPMDIPIWHPSGVVVRSGEHVVEKTGCSRWSALADVVRAVSCLMFFVGCGDDCQHLLQRYADEIHSYALRCDPVASNPCGAQLPTIVYEQSLDGGVKLEALSLNCTHAVNPTRTATATGILDEYLPRRCPTMITPVCQGAANYARLNCPMNRGSVTDRRVTIRARVEPCSLVEPAAPKFSQHA